MEVLINYRDPEGQVMENLDAWDKIRRFFPVRLAMALVNAIKSIGLGKSSIEILEIDQIINPPVTD